MCLVFRLIVCNAYAYALGEKMPKTKREAVPRKNIRVSTLLMDEVDRIVRKSGLYINRQQFIESTISARPFFFFNSKFLNVRRTNCQLSLFQGLVVIYFGIFRHWFR